MNELVLFRNELGLAMKRVLTLGGLLIVFILVCGITFGWTASLTIGLLVVILDLVLGRRV